MGQAHSVSCNMVQKALSSRGFTCVLSGVALLPEEQGHIDHRALPVRSISVFTYGYLSFLMRHLAVSEDSYLLMTSWSLMVLNPP